MENVKVRDYNSDSDSIPVGKYLKRGLIGVVALVGLSVALGSFYTVNQGEVAYVRHLGSAVKADPIGPGLHWKTPWIETVDRVNVTQKTVHIEPFPVNTVDNQMVELKINVTYNVPTNAVYHLLYEVGRIGDADISENITPIVKDRASRIFSTKNTNYISAQREAIQGEVTKSVHDALNDLFMVNVDSLQIESIEYSKAFVESNNNAVLAKNEAVREENRKKVVEYQAAQKVIEAQGLAQQAIADAEGKNKSAILAAEAQAKSVELNAEANAKAQIVAAEANVKVADADKQAAELRGQGNAIALKALVDSVGGPDKYISKLQAEALNKWNGSVPSMVLGGGGQNGSGVQMPIFLNPPSPNK